MAIRTMLLAAAMIVGVTLTGCNTMQGFGKDLSKVGDKIEGAAKKSK